jgi:hypothetical protein
MPRKFLYPDLEIIGFNIIFSNPVSPAFTGAANSLSGSIAVSGLAAFVALIFA